MRLPPGRRALLIVLIVASVIASGLLIAQDQEVIKVRSMCAADDPRAPDYIATLVDAELSVGNSYGVLTNGDQAFPAMLEAIASRLLKDAA